MTMHRKVVLKLLGVEPGFLNELGCPCLRCAEVRPRANTCAVLLVYSPDGSKVEHAALIDCGAGAVDGLIGLRLGWVDCVLNTHRHTDHILEADRLTNCLRRHAKHQMPLRWYCSVETWRSGVGASFPWLEGESGLRHHSLEHGVPVDFGFGVGLRVTPVDVYHGGSAKGAMNFVLEFGASGDARIKIVVAWDLLNNIPRYPGEDVSEKYTGPTASQLDPLHAKLFESIDLLLLEANTWYPSPRTGHSSVEAAMGCLVPLVFSPRRAVLVHYSGHEDADGPLTDTAFRERLTHRDCATEYEIDLGYHGQEFEWYV
jgi:hypothetical protein